MKVDMPVGIKNKFTFHVDDIKTGEHKEYEAYNIVLNSMWSRLVNFQPFFVNIHFGTGTGAFTDPARTSLYTHLGTKPATTEFQTRALPTSQWRRKIVLNPEEYVGAVISEIGVAYGSTASNLVTHAAPKDAEGNPMTLDPKTDTQIITIYADMYFVLAENMYGGKIKWVTPLANNELLSYLMGGSYPTQQFRVGRFPRFSDGVTPLGLLGQSTNILVANWIKDAANKKVATPVLRLGTTLGNGEVRSFGLGSSDLLGTFRGQLPIVGVYENYSIIGETIGAGDGVINGFSPNSAYANIEKVKIDGVEIDISDYAINITKKGTNPLLFSSLQWVVGGATQGTIANTTDGSISYGNHIRWDATGEIGIDVGENFTNTQFDTIRIYHGSDNGGALYSLFGCNNADFSNRTLVATINAAFADQWNVGTVSPASSYRYYVLKVDKAAYTREIELLTAADQIQFTTPPPLGSTITADYTVDYIPKDEFHVLDLQAAIQYGEVI
jgi:hypothetical protein